MDEGMDGWMDGWMEGSHLCYTYFILEFSEL